MLISESFGPTESMPTAALSLVFAFLISDGSLSDPENEVRSVSFGITAVSARHLTAKTVIFHVVLHLTAIVFAIPALSLPLLLSVVIVLVLGSQRSLATRRPVQRHRRSPMAQCLSDAAFHFVVAATSPTGIGLLGRDSDRTTPGAAAKVEQEPVSWSVFRSTAI